MKLGGHALDSLAVDAAVLADLAFDVIGLRAGGVDVLVVHGGGPQISALLDGVGLASHFHEGLRITDADTMEYVAMALELVNLRVVAALNYHGLDAVGLCGVDGSTIQATSLGPPWDRAGGSPKVRDDLIRSLWSSGATPVMSSVCVDGDGGLLNCNADIVAGAVAGALGAATLVMLSDVDQLRGDVDDATSAIASVSRARVRELVASGAVRDGMRPKLTAALDALDAGAARVILANGVRPHALRDALTSDVPTTEVLG